MPKALHDKLKRQAAKKGYSGERAEAYVYGTLNNVEKAQSIKGKGKAKRKKGK